MYRACPLAERERERLVINVREPHLLAPTLRVALPPAVIVCALYTARVERRKKIPRELHAAHLSLSRGGEEERR